MKKRKPSSERKKRLISLSMKKSWAKRKAEREAEAARLKVEEEARAREDYKIRKKQGLLTSTEKRRERELERRLAEARLKSLENMSKAVLRLPGFENKVREVELKLGRKLTANEKLELGTILLFGPSKN